MSTALRLLLALAMVALTSSSTAEADQLVVGYVTLLEAPKFHPLLTVTTEYTLAKSSFIPRRIYPALIPNAYPGKNGALNISVEVPYIDRHGRDTKGVFGSLATELITSGSFFYANKEGLTGQVSNDVASEFYKFFSRDSWGRRLVPDDMLLEPIEEIARSSGVRVRATTDLDSDGLKEAWISYRLMYDGDVGAALYEQSHSGEWTQIVNHCYMCD